MDHHLSLRQKALTLFTSVLLVLSWEAAAEECFVAVRSCVDPGGTRLIDGIPVTRDCWGWEEQRVCLTADTGTDGCATLVKDAEQSGPGGCRLVKQDCKETVTRDDGSTVCLQETEEWQCQTQIPLPPVNAQWTGKIEAEEERVEDSACRPYQEDASCVALSRECTGSQCIQEYACGGKELQGCSALSTAGCQEIKQPTGTPLAQGSFFCPGGFPDGVLKPGEGEVTDEERLPGPAPQPGTLTCAQGKPDSSCTETARRCIDADQPLREVEGQWYFSDCWHWEVTYRCQGEGSDTCAALRGEDKCQEESRTCLRMNDAGECESTEYIFTCEAAAADIGGTGEVLEDRTETEGLVHVSTCTNIAGNTSCRKVQEVCREPGGTKIVDGVPVTKDCWRSEITYACGSPGETVTTDNCLPLLEDDSCRLMDSVCLGTNEAGECTFTTRTYSCGGGKETVETGQQCDGTLCIAGLCEPAADEGSETLLTGAALLEIARQAGIYGDISENRLFSGTASGCQTKLAGFSCCRPSAAATGSRMNNSALGLSLTLGTQAGMEAIRFAGSPYVYDLLSSTELTEPLLQRLYGSAGSGVYEPSLSYYGVSVGWTSAGGFSLSFSPAGFFAAVALDLALDYFSCTQDDQLHALRRSQNLCHYVGSYCEKKGGSGCLTKRESWCCFNSRLALAVQKEGRKQLGMSWGTPEAPLCRGFTTEEFERLDFTRMDLTPILAEAALAITKKMGNVDATTARAQTRVEAMDPASPYREPPSFTGKCAAGVASSCPDSADSTLFAGGR